MLRIEFYHDGEQLYWWQHDHLDMWSRLQVAFRIIFKSRVGFSTTGSNDGRITVYKGGRQYKL